MFGPCLGCVVDLHLDGNRAVTLPIGSHRRCIGRLRIRTLIGAHVQVQMFQREVVFNLAEQKSPVLPVLGDAST